MRSDNQTMRGDYPFMMMVEQKPTTSDFDEKCDDLKKCIQKAYSFFMWYGSISKSQVCELFSILFLESLFLQMLVDIKEIFMMRGRQLCNERTDTFKNLLVELNNEMRRGTKFIGLSSQCLERELSNGNPITSSMRQEVVEGFRNLSGWLRDEALKPANKERADALADELGLNYEMKLFGCIGDGFKHHTNMVLNGLILISFPSMPNTQTDEFCTLFDNSISELKASKSWGTAFDSWRNKILKAYDLNNIVEDKYKVDYLKKIWKALDEQEQELLRGYGIVADLTRSPKERATMGFRIYDHLNTAPLDEAPRMSADNLQQYFLYVVQKQWIDDEIDRLKPPFAFGEMPSLPTKKTKKAYRLFKQNVNLKWMKDSLNEVYCRFLVYEEKETLKGKHNDLMTLMVYLYIICEMEGFFEDAYKHVNKVPFFKFCTEEAHFYTTKDNRTFRNRFDHVEDVYKKFCLHGSQKLDETVEKDFQKVMRIFHGTKYYEKLKQGMNN